jgi:hypothetical protein
VVLQDFPLPTDNQYANAGEYRSSKAPAAKDDIYTDCGGAAGGGIPLTWHDR